MQLEQCLLAFPLLLKKEDCTEQKDVFFHSSSVHIGQEYIE